MRVRGGVVIDGVSCYDVRGVDRNRRWLGGRYLETYLCIDR